MSRVFSGSLSNADIAFGWSYEMLEWEIVYGEKEQVSNASLQLRSARLFDDLSSKS